jgi:hypothetical protein
VRNWGGRLSPIIWQGRQWAVTVSGIECRDGRYGISAATLWRDEDRYPWVVHMSLKSWVDLPDFAEALRIARHYHAPINPHAETEKRPTTK